MSSGIPEFDLDQSLGYQVNRLALSYARALALRLARYDISVAQWAVLVVLWEDDGLSQRALSKQVAIDEATMARTVVRMERDGLVRRVRNRDDRRQVNVFVTDHATSLREKLIPCAIEVNQLATEPLSDLERQLALDLMRRMRGALDSRGQGTETEQ